MFLGAQIRYKVKNEKVRFTFSGLICSGEFEGWKPAYISKCFGVSFSKKKFGREKLENSQFCGKGRSWKFPKFPEIPNFEVRAGHGNFQNFPKFPIFRTPNFM